jgi:lipopolysaccharide transport system permease protein
MFRALWNYRGFISTSVKREFQSRYMGSALGALWTVLNPIAMIAVYTLVFSEIMRARLPGLDDHLSYGLFVMAGVITWGYFTEVINRSQAIFLEQSNLIKKMSFPKSTLPVIVLLSATVNFVLIFSLFLLFLLLSGRFPGWSIVAFLPLLLIQQMGALGAGVVLGTLNVFFRDVGQIAGIVLQFWFWLTPIVYPLSALPENVRFLIGLNPMTHLVDAYQQIILLNNWPHWSTFLPQLITTVLLLGVGFLVFRRLSGDLADEL